MVARLEQHAGELTLDVTDDASDLGLAPNTVARAYRELETTGFVRTAGRNGTVVLPLNDGPHINQQATRHAEAYIQAMRSLGLGPTQ